MSEIFYPCYVRFLKALIQGRCGFLFVSVTTSVLGVIAHT